MCRRAVQENHSEELMMAASSGTHLQPQHLRLRLEDAEFKVILGYKRPRYRRGKLSLSGYLRMLLCC